jgi:nucleoside-diphosphate-sugar epimerase
MRILVTGGAGFIDGNLCERLLGRGEQVWSVDNLRLGRRSNIAHLASLPAFRFLEPEVLDRPALAAGPATFRAFAMISRGCRHRAGRRDGVRPKRFVTRSRAFSPTVFDLD